jgi:hypothetical protein
MGKFLTWVVLGLFVVVVPFGSWYYLKSGADYRRQAISELSKKDSLSKGQDTLHILRGKTTLFIPSRQVVDEKILTNLRSQFGQSESFQIIKADSLSELYRKGIYAKYISNKILLIDTGLYIRNVYGSSVEDIRKVVEHTAIILPRVREMDIKMQKDNGKK